MRPRLLDLFCGAGGAAMGYHRAGFDVVGVDVKAQPRYPFDFVQADAMTYPLDGFDAIHASPPCQHYSATMRMTGTRDNHPDLLAPTQARLEAWGGRWVIENVDGAPFDWAFCFCGWAFGIDTHRHRFFRTDTWGLVSHPGCPGPMPEGQSINPYKSKNGRSMSELRTAMGVEWMNLTETSLAIPPAYTEHIGRQLIGAL